MTNKPNSYAEIAKSEKFKTLLATKRRFLLPMTIFFMVFYFALPVLTSYTDILNASAFGPVSWAWVFAFAQFAMTWALCIIYQKKSVKFDAMVEEIKQEANAKTGGKAA